MSQSALLAELIEAFYDLKVQRFARVSALVLISFDIREYMSLTSLPLVNSGFCQFSLSTKRYSSLAFHSPFTAGNGACSDWEMLRKRG